MTPSYYNRITRNTQSWKAPRTFHVAGVYATKSCRDGIPAGEQTLRLTRLFFRLK